MFDASRLDKCLSGHRSILQNTEELCDAVWRVRTSQFPLAYSLTGANDPVLSEFAASVTANTPVIDLRKPSVGDGFDWSSLNSGRTPIRRAGTDLLFALERPPGLFRRLFGGK